MTLSKCEFCNKNFLNRNDKLLGSSLICLTCKENHPEFCYEMNVPIDFNKKLETKNKPLTFAYCEVVSCREFRFNYGIGYICKRCGHTQTTEYGFETINNVEQEVKFNCSNEESIMTWLFLADKSNFNMTKNELKRLVYSIDA